MESAAIQIERIAREVIEHAARTGRNGAGENAVGRLVEEVLKRIELEPAVAGAEPGRAWAGDREETSSARRCPAGGEPLGHRQGSAPAISAPARVLKLESRVVTLSDLAGRLEGIQQITLPPRVVITPAARDELQRQAIAISYTIMPRRAARPRMAMVWGQAETNYDAGRLIDALAREGMLIEQMAQTGLVQVIHELSDEISKGGRLAVLLTGKPAVALCLANRRRGVRAVMAQTVATTVQAVRAAGANLLVVDPSGRGWFELKRELGQFGAGAPYPCPAEYRGHLE